MRFILALLTLVAGPQAALAAADPCEKFKDADAYNSCLASYGPAVGEHRIMRAPEREDFSRPARQSLKAKAAAKAQSPETQGPHVTRKANGRVRIEILVPSGR
ncbi:hypothetical protein [Rhodoblastus sp.]|uniref:hypothetical protein n=1 Tax=Rhodoblastus sp. TaxID=1962975 RepID=UPI003F9E04BC